MLIIYTRYNELTECISKLFRTFSSKLLSECSRYWTLWDKQSVQNVEESFHNFEEIVCNFEMVSTTRYYKQYVRVCSNTTPVQNNDIFNKLIDWLIKLVISIYFA